MISSITEQDIVAISTTLHSILKRLSGKTLLITGGSGFLGTYIIATVDYANKYILRKPCKVISVDNFVTGRKRSMQKTFDKANIREIHKDVTKPLHLSGKIDFIIHAAGLASPAYYKRYPLETIETAVYGTQHMLEMAKEKKVSSFLFFSSSEVYGNPDKKFIPTPETYLGNVSSIGPRACYDESKRLGETLCMVYNEKFNVPIKIVRPFNVYGPGMMHDDYRVIPTFIWNALHKKSLPVHAKGRQTRSFCYISDAVVGFFLVLLSTKNGEVYNIGNDKTEVTISKLASIVSQISGVNVAGQKVQYPSHYPREDTLRRCPNIRKIRTILRFYPKISLSEGLRRTIDWYKEEYSL